MRFKNECTGNPPSKRSEMGSSTATDLFHGRRPPDNGGGVALRPAGLVYPSPYAIFVTFFRKEHPESAMTKARLGKVPADARLDGVLRDDVPCASGAASAAAGGVG